MAPRLCSQAPMARRSRHLLVSITVVPPASPFRLLRFTPAPGIPPCLSRPAAATTSQSVGPEASGRSYSPRAGNTRNTLHAAMIGEKSFLPFSGPRSPAEAAPSLVSKRAPLLRAIRGVRAPFLTHKLLHELKTLAELAIGTPQRLFCVNLQSASQSDDHKQEIAQFFQLLLRSCSLSQFLQFFLKFGIDPLLIGKIEAGTRGPLLIFLSDDQRRRGRWHAVQHALLMNILARLCSLLALNRLPVLQHLPGITDLNAAKNMRVAADQLGIDMFIHVADGKIAVLARNLGMQIDLEHKIAQFIGQFFHIIPLKSLHYLIRFFNDVFDQALMGLFAVPGAAIRITAQAHGDVA